MPVAELKATESITEAVRSGRHFKGPFTPQLSYDGGLDYRWARHDVNLHQEEKQDLQHPGTQAHTKFDGQRKKMIESSSADAYIRFKRRGFHFGYDNALDWIDSYHKPPVTSTHNQIHEKELAPPFSESGPPNPRRTRHQLRNSLHLENVQFILPGDAEDHSRTSNRKTTIVQVSPSLSSLPAIRRLPSIADHLAHRLEPKPSYLSNTSTLVPSGNDCENN